MIEWSGEAVSLVCVDEHEMLKDIEKLIKQTLPREIIAGFEPEAEVLRVLEKKAGVGQFVHSDYCRFDGRTVNQWLAEPELIPQFLDTLQQRGWIKRHEDPQHSRFWQMITGEQAPMFGVFSAHEQQLIHDWIAGDWLAEEGLV